MKNTDTVIVRITPEQKQFIDQLCKATGLDTSKIVRYLIDDKIKSLKSNE